MNLRRAVVLALLICTLLPVGVLAQSADNFPAITSFDSVVGGPACFWIRGEYLLWWLKDQALPPLVTTSATQSSVGRLGFPDTSVLYGGDVDGNVRQGFRITAGATPFTVMNDCARLGLEGSFFVLERNNNGFGASSNGDPVLARPFVDALTGQQRVEQVANLPIMSPAGGVVVGAVRGAVTISNPSDMLGGELNAALVVSDDEMVQVHFLGGVRYLYLQEKVDVRADLLQAANAAAGIPETAFVVEDYFHTRNEFFGGQLGMRTIARLGDFSLEWQGKVALGSTRQTVVIDGTTTATVTGSAPITSPGGLLALPTNMGTYSRDRFTVVPEVGLTVGYQFTPMLRGFLGYNFLYWSSVVRPGPQIDTVVNPNYLPPAATPAAGPARPTFPGVGTDLWVQGLTFGVELSY
jgi:hypothetical protein